MKQRFTYSIFVLILLLCVQCLSLKAQSVTVLSPNGGELLPVNASFNITWSQTFLNNIRIEYSTNNGSSWTEIINSYPAVAGSFTWSVPNTITNTARIRLTDLVNTLITDISDQVFMIQDNSNQKYGGGSRDGFASDINIANSLMLVSFNQGNAVPVGSMQDIVWAGNGVEFVDIEWSSDNGSNWNLLALSVQANLEVYAWQVPQALGSNHLIRVKDSFNPLVIFAVSQQTFTIINVDTSKFFGGSGDGFDFNTNILNEINLVFPAGGEELPENSYINVLWAANLTNNVLLEYSTNNGSNWISMGSPVPANLGSYSWQLPMGFSTQMRVRVSDAANPGQNFDISSTFTILSQTPSKYFGGGYDGHTMNENQPDAVLMVYPNGNETLYAGDVINLNWTAMNVAYINLEYSINGGSSWTTIANAVPAVLQSYTWVVPFAYTNQNGLIRITDAFNISLKDTSDAPFTIPFQSNTKYNGGNYDGNAFNINVANSLAVVYPNGGEALPENTEQQIRWYANNIDFVRIEYSTNNGSSWILVIPSHPANLGFYSWTVPTTPTLQAKIRVLDVMNQINMQDQSDQVFAIYNNSPTKYQGGSFDGSDVNVNQSPSITVTSPVGGEIWYEGLQATVSWTQVNINTVNIEISSNNGSTWTQVGAGQPAVLGLFTWNISGFTGDNSVLVRVSDSSTPSIHGISAAPLSIPLYFVQKNYGGSGDGFAYNINSNNSIQIVSPNGGERFAENSLQYFQWIANDIGNVRLEYSTNNGSSWILVSASQSGNMGTFPWQIPTTPSNNALVRVADIFNQTTVFDISNSPFMITTDVPDKHFGGNADGYSMNVNQPSSITVLTPNGGETMYEGEDINITWNSVNVTDVVIEISTNNGSNWHVLSSSEPATLGSYMWNVSGFYAAGTGLIRIRDLTDPSLKDSSDTPFTIPQYIQNRFVGGSYDGHAKGVNSNQSIQVLAPNGGEVFAENSTQQILWNANDISNVRLEYSTNNGSSWILISPNESGNLGQYNWVIPPTPSLSARVRVLDVLNQSNVFDISDNVFAIQGINTDKYFGGSGDGHDMNINQSPGITLLTPNGGDIWFEGQTVNITWSSVNVTAVAIDISSNNGSSWTTLDPDEPAVLGSFTWIVSGFYSQNNNLIRIRSTINSGVNDVSNSFTIPFYSNTKNRGGGYDGFAYNINAANAIQLLTLNGGEILAEGSVEQIQWNANGITNIRLEYSTNNGSNWILISPNEPANSGTYNWVVPSTPTQFARVRVADVLNQFTLFDFSDTTFQIQSVNPAKFAGGSFDGHTMNVNQPPSITLLTPNGGETWYEGQAMSITWSSINISTVAIDISSNNGSSWTTIHTAEPAVTGTYFWPVAGFAGNTSVRIRVRDESDPLVNDISNAGFTIPFYAQAKNFGGSFDGFASDINGANAIQVINPQGGEIFAENSTQQIQWNANNITNVRIEYSTNNGSSWILISANEPANANSYNWQIPQTLTHQAKIKVSDVLNQTNLFALSNGVFSIESVNPSKYLGGIFDGHAMNVNQPPAITLLVPNGGETYYEGQTLPIQWTSVNVTDVSVEISSDNGSAWTVINPTLPAVIGGFNWVVSGFSGNGTVQVRIRDVSDPLVQDISNAGFTIPHFVASKFNGGNFDGFAMDINNATAIQVISPNGGEIFAEASAQQILWNANNINNVRLEYSTNNGSSWILISANEPGNTGSYNWIVPQNVNTLTARIRVADVLNQSTRFDISDGVFAIQSIDLAKFFGGAYDGHVMNVNQSPSVVVNTPNGGETYFEGQNIPITWTSVNLNFVDIEISSNNGSSWTQITSAEPASSGLYVWTVTGMGANASALIRISESGNSGLNDVSDAGFTIPQYLTSKNFGGAYDGSATDINSANILLVVSPNGGENMPEFSTQNILWSSNGLANVRIEYSSNNGSSWNLITASTPATQGSFAWSVPSLSTSQALIRIIDVQNPLTISDVSDAVFQINGSLAQKYFGGSYDGFALGTTGGGLITLTSPNGGQVWLGGSTQNITWTSSNVTLLDIEASADNGSSWTLIAASVSANQLTYPWSIPDAFGSPQCLIRLTDSNDPIVTAVSNAVFEIKLLYSQKYNGGPFDGFSREEYPGGTVTLTAPNTAVTLIPGTTTNITWTFTNLGDIGLEYSTNNGSSWVNILSSYPASSGTYAWLVPNTATEIGYVRIYSANVIGINDISDQAFRIPLMLTEKYYGGSYDGFGTNSNQAPVLTITQPNGGENVHQGNNYPIRWTSSDVNVVELEYSLDNGSNWVLIANNIAAQSGEYYWNVPFQVTDHALVRITDALTPSLRDTSDQVFTIPFEFAQKYRGGSGRGNVMDINSSANLVLVYPDLFENIPGNTQIQIQWQANTITSVNLDYSTNNGSSWINIVNGTNANTGLYTWAVPAITTANGRIRISDLFNPGTIFDISDQAFAITSPIVDKYYGGSFDGHSFNENQPPTVTVVQPNGGEIWYAGDVRILSWSFVNVTDIALDYSTNNGSTWNLITASQPAVISNFAWTIPQISSTQALIRVRDAANSLVFDVSDAVFTIPVELAQKFRGGSGDGFASDINASNALTLITPNGGESLADGSLFTIQWTANNLQNILIEYSTNNGSAWQPVIVSTPANIGTYTWSVPSVNTTQALVRISDLNNPGQYNDVSDQVFTINAPVADKYFGGSYDGHAANENQPPAVTVLYPNGGEILFSGNVATLTWSSINVFTIDIEYSTNNGSSWNLITAQEPAALGSYVWNIPIGITGASLIRMTDSGNGLVQDVSDASFMIPLEFAQKFRGGSGDGFALGINAANSIFLLSPDGGETLADGSQFSIQWVANNLSNITIEFSSNNGSNWQAIIVSTPANTGTYMWTVPAVNTTQGRIKISDLISPGQFNDMSSQVFTINGPVVDKYYGGSYDGHASAVNQPPSLTVTYPNGGETLFAGDVQVITWTQVNVSNLDIDYSTNNGSSWVSIVTQVPASLNNYSWTLPVGISGVSLIRITDSGNNLVTDHSDASFLIPLEVAQKFRGGSGDGYAMDINASNAFALITPNGGESLADGSQYNILWVANNFTNVTLEFSSDNGTNWQAIAVSTPANTGNYLWTVPALSTTLGRVRISDLVNPNQYNDISDQVFTIIAPIADKYLGGSYDGHASGENQPPSITVNYPNGGEILYAGDFTNITWSSINVNTIDIEYSTNNGSSWNLIDAQQPASLGFYLWNIPGNISGDALIRLTDSGNGLVSDISNASFQIPLQFAQKYRGGSGDGYAMDLNAGTALQLISPNGGEGIADGTLFDIQWVANGFVNLILEYSTNNGSVWQTITVSTPANTGLYSWSVPGVATNQARVRISDLVNPGLYFDISDQTFTILGPIPDKYFGGSYDGVAMNENQPPAITLNSPSGGEVFYAGNQHAITWTSINVTSVDIEYSTNNGSSWNTIALLQPASLNIFHWNVPQVSSLNALVRIKDSGNPLVLDVSNASFIIPFELVNKFRGGNGDGYAMNINAANTLQLITPNGGESLADGSQYSIQWYSNNLHNVTLEYSTNNGTVWQAIIPSVPGNAGSYLWSVPGVTTTLAKVRVSDLIDPFTYNDVSDAVFTIIGPVADKFYGGSYDGHSFGENQPPAITLVSPNGGEFVVPDFQYEITWTSTNIANVGLEYSDNNGSTWNQIVSSYPAGAGNYFWTVPYLNSDSVLVRITDQQNSLIRDTSDAVFTVPNVLADKFKGGSADGHALDYNAANAIVVLSPNGGENFPDAINVSIAFAANGVDNVAIEYSSNNGSNWTPVSINTQANLGSFPWVTPTVSTLYGLIRISDLNNPGQVWDMSDAVFTITAPLADKYFGGSYDGHALSENQAPFITVVSPNGGEVIYAEDVYPVVWTSVNVNTVNIDFSIDNGSSWINIDTQVPATQSLYNWTVPLIYSNQVLVRIVDPSNTLVSDTSDAFFVIPFQVADKFKGGNGSGHDMDINRNRILQVVSPNGGEVFASGSTQFIEWASNTLNHVNIELSTNQGSNWSTLAVNVPANLSTYSWQVGLSGTNQGLIRISDAVFVSTIRDTSDGVFTIIAPDTSKYFGGAFDGHAVNENQQPFITLLTPNGGENWSSQTVQNITWTQVNVSNVNIEYSVDNGSNWIIIQSNLPTGAGVYSWNIPNNGSNVSLVKITDASNSLLSDISNAVFNIPFLDSAKYAGGSFDGVAMDENTPPTLTLNSPNGGEVWFSQSSQLIQWTSTNLSVVQLDFSSDNGSTWTLITGAVPASAGSYLWTVNNVSTNVALVRVTDAVGGILNDQSDAWFEIPHLSASKYNGGSYDGHGSDINAANILVLSEPNGGEFYPVMSPQNVLWAANSINAVNIEYSVDNGSSWFTLATNVSGQTTTFNWTAPGPATQFALVRISQSGNPNVNVISQAVFTTVDPIADKYKGGSFDGHASESNATPVLTLLSPNGGEVWLEGSNRTITWSQVNVSIVDLDLSTDNGSNWTNIAVQQPAQVGAYNWLVSGPGSNTSLVRVVNSSNSIVRDSSNLVFEIPYQHQGKYTGGSFDGHASSANLPPAITVIAPNGGENFYPFQTQSITWTSTNVSNVGIEFSTDNGSTWINIVSAISAQSGNYSWVVPALGSQQALVRVFDVSSPGVVNDVSNATFNILHLVVNKYNGGSYDGVAYGENHTTATIAGSDTACSGGNINLSFTLTGSAPWDVTFTDGTNPQTISGITSSPYQTVIPVASTRTFTVQSVSSPSGTGVGIGFATAFIYPLPGIAFPPEPSVCLGQSTQVTVGLSGTNPWTFTWTDGTTPITITGITSQPYTINVTPTVTTSYSFTGVQDAHCSSNASFVTTVYVIPLPDAIVSGSSTVCPGVSAPLQVNFTGVAPFELTWTDGTNQTINSGITANPYIFQVSALQTTTYTLVSVSDSACTGQPASSAVLTIVPEPDAVIAGSNTICIGDQSQLQVNLNGISPWDITWTDGAIQTQVTGITASPYQFMVTPSVNTSYDLVSVSNVYCSGTIGGNADIEVRTLPTATLSGTQTICDGTTAQLSLNLSGNAPWDITWTDGSTPVQVTGISTQPYLFTITPVAQTSYSVTSVQDNLCSASVSTQAVVSLNALPTATLSGASTICTGATAQQTILLSGLAPWDITWTDGSTPVSESGITSSSYLFTTSPSATVSYSITALSDANCIGSGTGQATVQVETIPASSISADQTICLGCTASLSLTTSGSGPWDITWTDGTNQSSITGISSSLYVFLDTPGATTTYSLVSMSGPYCAGTVSDSAVVTVIPFPTATLSGDQTVCTTANLNVNLTGFSPWDLTYTDGTTQTLVAGISASPYILTVSATSTRTYSLVSIVDVNQTSGMVSGQAVVTITLPGSILANNGSNPQCTSFDIDWSAAINATSYKIDVASDNLFTQIISGYNGLNIGNVLNYTITGLTAGTQYYVRIQGVNGCGDGVYSNTASGSTSPMPVTTVATSASSVSCSYFDANWSVGTHADQYRLDVATDTGFVNILSGYNNLNVGNVTTHQVSGLTAGTAYYYRVRSENTCGQSANSIRIVQVTINLQDSLQTSSNSPVCAGNVLGLTAEAFNGVTYLWNGPLGFTSNQAEVSLISVSPSNSGVYTVTASYNGCSPVTATESVQINDNIFSVSLGSNSPLCSGETLQLSSSGGDQNSIYTWTGPNGYSASGNNAQRPSITPVDSGVYTITVTSPGCNTISDTLSVIVSPSIAVTIGSNGPICEGTHLYFNATNLPGSPYSWAGPNAFSSTLRSPSISNATILADGIYTLTITQPGCNTQTYTLPVIVSPNLSSMTLTNNLPVCEGQTLSLTSTTFVNTNYSWTGPNGFTANTPIISIPNTTIANSGQYVVIASNPGCSGANRAVNVSILPALVVTAGSNSPVCQNSSINFSASTHTNATYSWTGPNGFSASGRTPSIPWAEPVQHTGQFTVQVTQAGCGTNSATVNVMVGGSISNVIAQSNSPLCSGTTLNLSSTLVPNSTVLWQGPGGFTSHQANLNISNVQLSSAGIYTYNVMSPGCGTQTRSVTVQVYDPAVLSPVSNSPVCEGGNLTISTGTFTGATYAWTGPNGFNTNTAIVSLQNVNPNRTGIYTLTVTQPGCGTSTATVSVVVGNSLAGIISSANSPVCLNSNLTLSTQNISGITYQWNGPNNFSSSNATVTIPSVTSAAAGIYTLTASSPGCGSVITTSGVIVNNPGVITVGNNSPICGGSDLYFTATGNRSSTYLWQGPNNFVSSVQSPSISSALPSQSGVYTLTVNDPGCGSIQLTTLVQIGQNLNTASASNNSPVCAGTTVHLSANTINGATYSWQGPNGFTSTLQNPSITNPGFADAGTYSVTFTTVGCLPLVRTTNVYINPAITVSPSSNSPVCQGGALYLNANSLQGVSYSWAGPNGFTSNAQGPGIVNVQPSSAGTYTLTISKPGCNPVSATTVVVVGTLTSSIAAGSNSPLCVGSDLNLSVTTNPNYSYSWTGPNGFVSTVSNPQISGVSLANAGAYQVVVSSVGCSPTSRSLSVSINNVPALNAGNNGPICEGGVLYLSVNQISGATYLWQGPNGFTHTAQSPGISNVQQSHAGVYTLSVNTTSCGITSTTTTVVIGIGLSNISASSNTALCEGGDLMLTATDRPGYTFSWTGPNGFTSTLAQPVINSVTLVNRGSYTVNFASPGCGTASRTANVVINTPASVTASNSGPVCANGVLYFTGRAPTGSTYLWNGPSGFSSIQPSPAIGPVQLSHAGIYTLNAQVPGCGLVSVTTTVVVNICKEGQTTEPSAENDIASDTDDSVMNDTIPEEVEIRKGYGKLTLWPNPSEGSFVQLKWEGLSDKDKTITVKVFDANGKIVLLKSVNRDKYLTDTMEDQLNFPIQLARGIYTIETVHDGNYLYGRMIVQ